jgi:hypothetical protein
VTAIAYRDAVTPGESPRLEDHPLSSVDRIVETVHKAL